MNSEEEIRNIISAKRRERLKNSGQLTLGALIDKIKGIFEKRSGEEGPEATIRYDFANLFPTALDSWRGSYAELALNFETDGIEMKLSTFLDMLQDAVGKTFTGYKGGDFKMTEETPIWVANYGHGGNTAIIDVLDKTGKVILVTGYREF